jgi:hypothetical protein
MRLEDGDRAALRGLDVWLLIFDEDRFFYERDPVMLCKAGEDLLGPLPYPVPTEMRVNHQGRTVYHCEVSIKR